MRTLLNFACVFLILTIISVRDAAADSSESMETSYEKEDLDACMKEVGISEKEFNETVASLTCMFNTMGEMSDADPAAVRKAQCFGACMLQRSDMLKGNSLDMTILPKILEEFPEKSRKRVGDSFLACADQVKKEGYPDRCELSHVFICCVAGDLED